MTQHLPPGRHRHPRRRAFATAMAIVLMTLVGVALVGLTSLVASDARRTRDAAADAQLRQLLLAAVSSARQHAAASQANAGEQKWSLTLPASLRADGAVVNMSMTPAGADLEARVEARLSTRHAEQTLRFSRTATGWALISAR